MDDIVEAQELIKAIRRAKHVDDLDGADETAVDLTNALKMLSEELYSKPTHFILELIQNADDNRYAGDITPKLSLLYRQDGYLWVGINELGFTEANVRAICRIAASTKKVENHHKGYIGEKGIGFKAVFKVADVVWIKSGAMSFKFDKTKPLGMIAPEWTEFASNSLVNERTMFCFRIPEQEHQDIVQARLLELKPELLLFLRQLRNIDVKVQSSDGIIQHSFSLCRSDRQNSGVRHTTLQHITAVPGQCTLCESFIVFQRTATQMPSEAKRQAISETEVLIAFPVDIKLQPVLRDRMTFNFLPIRSYGFSFVLQADFMLSASREDILQDNKWNEALVAATLELFVSGVDTFNMKNLVKYTWPRYAGPQGNAYGTIFHRFFALLVDRLRSHHALESQAGTLQTPSSLQSVPSHFNDAAVPPRPLLMASAGFQAYTSTSYAAQDLIELLVKPQSSDTFCDILRAEVSDRPATFHQRSAMWHSRLAAALLRIDTYKIQNVRLIPLQDRKWISSKDKPFYFAEISDSVNVPHGIQVAMISETAARDQSRRQLFAALGAETLNSTQVFELILQQHYECGGPSSTWTIGDIVEHAWFLYNAPSRPRHYTISDLYVATRSATFCKGKELYMDVPGSPFRVSELFGNDSAIVRYIDDQYLTRAPPPSARPWHTWLQNELGVNTLPKLVSSLGSTVSPEFSWLVEAKPASVWLGFLKDHRNDYAATLTSSSLETFLSNALVECTDGLPRKLRDTYLQTKSIAEEPLATGIVPMIALDNPQDPSWLDFSRLGLGTRCDLRFYTTILGGLPALVQSPPTHASIKKIYSCIQSLMAENKELVSGAAVVHVATPRPGRWVNIDDSRWKAPACLTKVVALSGRYPDLHELFINTLDLKDADATDIVDELSDIGGAVEHITAAKTLLFALNDCMLMSAGVGSALERITTGALKVLPVRDETDAVRLRAASDASWFVPDRKNLRDAFANKVALLDLTDKEISAIKPLFHRLSLQKRLLTNHVVEETEAVGDLTFHPSLTDSLRSKARYIVHLIDTHSRAAALIRLSAVEVWSAANVVLRRHVRTESGPVFGTDEAGWVVLREFEGCIQVLVLNAAMAKDNLPYGPLCDRLTDTFGISIDKQMALLTILVTNNVEMIEYMLERAGLLPDTPIIPESDLMGVMSKDDEASGNIGKSVPTGDTALACESRTDEHLQRDSTSSRAQPSLMLQSPTADRGSGNHKAIRSSIECLTARKSRHQHV